MTDGDSQDPAKVNHGQEKKAEQAGCDNERTNGDFVGFDCFTGDSVWEPMATMMTVIVKVRAKQFVAKVATYLKRRRWNARFVSARYGA